VLAGPRTSIVRAAYYMSNWDSALDTARDEGVVHTFFPAEIDHTGVRYVEGPATCSPADVAAAFAEALGRVVRTMETPRSELAATFRALGFSDVAAASYPGSIRVRQAVGTVPPSMTYSVPVIAPALGETTNATSSATSRGVAGRPSGMPPSAFMMICLPPS
jgi:hypothetical protein